MDLQYDIFECLQDGSVAWRDSVTGLIAARQRLQEFSHSGGNDYFAMRLPTREVVFRADGVRKEVSLAKRVVQIAYTEKLRTERADVLRSRGYGVLSVLGNEPAKILLTALKIPCAEIAFFIVGHAAPDATRKEIVDWLKTLCPHVKIIALNPPNQQILRADYNVLQNGPESWLPIIANTGI
jgi:hypothetical protein